MKFRNLIIIIGVFWVNDHLHKLFLSAFLNIIRWISFFGLHIPLGRLNSVYYVQSVWLFSRDLIEVYLRRLFFRSLSSLLIQIYQVYYFHISGPLVYVKFVIFIFRGKSSFYNYLWKMQWIMRIQKSALYSIFWDV